MKISRICWYMCFLHVSCMSQIVDKTMLRLPDTGVTSSYTNTFGEDNDFNIFSPYFIINGNGLVTDTITGLMWQETDGGEMTIENAIIYCNTLNLGGYTDWRLPNAHEAFSILNHQNANPALDVNVFTNTGAEYWWTSDRQLNDSTKVWVTNAGGGIGNHPKAETISAGGSKKFHARAVRNITNPITVNHFVNNGNGTITDNLTGLIWQQLPYTDTITWEQALTYADTLMLGGASDWRLPNIKELQSINDESAMNPSLNTNYFTVSGAKKFWSSTSLPNQNTKAWYLQTQFGITTYQSKTGRNFVLCVRGNQVFTGISEFIGPKLFVFPNPFTSTIQCQKNLGSTIFELTNTEGQLLYAGNDIENQAFDWLKPGIYFLKVVQNETSIIKLIKEE